MSAYDANSTGSRLIAASTVNGTTVFDFSGEKIGSVHDLMVDKASGKVDYALMSFGGFLGMGEKYHPLPWTQLKYDPSRNGYVVNLSRAQLEGAPNYDRTELSSWDERRYNDVDDYYGAYDKPFETGEPVTPGLSDPLHR